MRRLAYFDMIGGASGNMLLAALIDAGASVDVIKGALQTLPLPEWSLEISRDTKLGVSAMHVHVEVAGQAAEFSEPPERTLRDVLDIIDASALSAKPRSQAKAIFSRLGEAEARAHNIDINKIHFHEVGQTDAILDVTGICVALDHLGIDEVQCSPFPVGRGLIRMHHGLYPNPPPATAAMLLGTPMFDAGYEGETVTTTAAAVLKTLCSTVAPMPAMTGRAIGYGSGTYDFPVPNVTRVFIGEMEERPVPEPEMILLETNIDDMSPQDFELAILRIRQAGAADVWMTPIIMKKQRPAILLSALADGAVADSCAKAILAETTSLGVRMHRVQKRMFDRSISSIQTPYGEVRVKTSTLDGLVRETLEYDDLLAIAKKLNLSIHEVREAVMEFMRREK